MSWPEAAVKITVMLTFGGITGLVLYYLYKVTKG